MNNSVQLLVATIFLVGSSISAVDLKEMSVLPAYWQSSCQKHSPCNNTDEIVQAIISDEENYQRLTKAFFPINHGRPRFMLIIFFANETVINRDVCVDREPFAGMIFRLNGKKNVYGTMWYSSTIYNVISAVMINEMGLFIPQGIVGQFFNISPAILDYNAVCLTVPYLIPPDNDNSVINNVLLPVIILVSYTK